MWIYICGMDNNTPQYTSKEVAQKTGVKLISVQTFALHHKLGVKKEGRRLYSEADIEAIRARGKPGRPARKAGKPRTRKAKAIAPSEPAEGAG